eukprot:724169-Prymnesium_polylepis.1
MMVTPRYRPQRTQRSLLISKPIVGASSKARRISRSNARGARCARKEKIAALMARTSGRGSSFGGADERRLAGCTPL